MAASPKNPVLRVIRQMGLVRPLDVETRGIPRAQLYRLVRKGLVARQAREIYVASQHPYTTEHTLAQVAPPDLAFRCTVRLARAVWQLRPTTLPDVCAHLRIPLRHHDALSDAEACARIVIAAVARRHS